MRSRKGFAALRGAVYAVLFTGLWTWVILSVRPLDDRLGYVFPDWVRVPGFLLLAFGAVLALSCVAVFAWFGRGTPAPFDAPREFVALGPYRWLRNPMYLGAAGVMFGVGLLLESPATIGVVALFLLATHMFVILYEEPTLERRFGDGYLEYKRAVRRWVPRPPAG